MLLSVFRMSPEKAKFVVTKYPTPFILRQAFLEAMVRENVDKEQEEQERTEKRQKTGKEPRGKSKVNKAENLLEYLGQETTRRVGPKLSALIFKVMMSGA